MGTSITAESYGGEPTLTLRAGDYEAIVLPGIGGHLVALRDVRRGFAFLREPLASGMGVTRYREHPIPYGVPLLFPPNRIADGTFTMGGETYRFPINEPSLGNHLHGFFATSAWEVVSAGTDGVRAETVLRVRLRDGDEVYRIFPHRLTLELGYALGEGGLELTVSARNDSDRPMPFLLGFHTALRIPFSPESSAEDCALYVNLGEQWELSERKLPSGRKLARDPMADAIARGEGNPYAHPIDALFSAAPLGGPNECRVRDRRLGVELVYRTDQKFRTWMLWNDDAQSGFLCPEPMTCLVNAPNLDLPWDVSGMLALAPGESWSATSRFFVEPGGAK